MKSGVRGDKGLSLDGFCRFHANAVSCSESDWRFNLFKLAVGLRLASCPDQEGIEMIDNISLGNPANSTIQFEGVWEDLQEQGAMLAGKRVRITIIDEPTNPVSASPSVNTAMLEALQGIEEITKQMQPKKDLKDYLRDAREGAMYGIAE